MTVMRALVLLAFLVVAVSPIYSVPLSAAADGFGSTSEPTVQGKDEKEKDKKAKGDQEKANSLAGNSSNPDKDAKFGDNQRDDNDNGDNDNRITNAQADKEDTNVEGLDFIETRGHVTELRCDRDPKEIDINNVDGLVTLFLFPERSKKTGELRKNGVVCKEVAVGDFLYVHEGRKHTEAAYDAFVISCEEDEDEEDDNGNENEDRPYSLCGNETPPNAEGRASWWPF